MTRPALRNEEGWALVTSVTLLAIMLTLGLASYASVDNGSKQSRKQREAESSLQLNEGVLYSQAVVLSRSWPTASNPYPPSCTSAVAATETRCPNPRTLAAAQDGGGSSTTAAFRSTDFVANGSWGTKVRDNFGALQTAYDPASANHPLTGTVNGATATCAAPCTYDFNQDRQLWVQTRTVVRGQPRNLVALLKLELLAEDMPRSAVTSGALIVSNQNNTVEPTVNGTDGGVFVQCTPTTGSNTSQDSCASYRSSGDTADVTPRPQKAASSQPLMTPDQLARMKERARIDGKLYQGCPTMGPNGYDLMGPVVWVEGCTSPPQMANNLYTLPCPAEPPVPAGMAGACINTMARPGILIWHCGSATFTGGANYVGVIYMVNNSDGTCAAPAPTNKIGASPPKCPKHDFNNHDRSLDVLEFGGNFHVWGSVIVDGNGCFRAGSNGMQVYYDRNVFSAISSFGTAGLVQSSWRELPGNSAF